MKSCSDEAWILNVFPIRKLRNNCHKGDKAEASSKREFLKIRPKAQGPRVNVPDTGAYQIEG
jgi:hypothetical protein